MKTNTSYSNIQNQTGNPTNACPSNQLLSDTSSQLITLEIIAQRKAQKLEELRQAKKEMTNTLHQLFAPVENKGGMEGIMQHVNTGIAVYDGVRTGIKIMQRIRSLFRTRKRR